MYRRVAEEGSDTDSSMGTAGAKENTSLIDKESDKDKLSGKAWGRVGKYASGKTPYPKSVSFIVGNEFCERFCFYGMRAILVLYLTGWLGFDGDVATKVFHAFVMLCYFTPIIGAILADGYIGRYNTIFYLSIIYAIGNVVLSLTAFPPPFWVGPAIGLILIGFGTGGIKPCVSAFGGDQFTSDQESERTQFFSVFYFAINLGSLLSMIITPLLREYVRCFDHSCFPVAFGVPALLMLASLILFVAGKSKYKMCPPSGNVIGKSFFCITRAIKNKCDKSTIKDKDHWLDYADDKYEKSFISDLKQALHILLLFIPIPMFWALFDQQGSRWILQAEVMDGSLFGGLQILPDQMPALNALLIIVFIPLFETVIYPLLAKCNLLTRALQRMVVGMSFAAAAFIFAGVLQLKMEAMMNISPPDGVVGLRFINSAPCDVFVNSTVFSQNLQVNKFSEALPTSPGNYPSQFSAVQSCTKLTNGAETSNTLNLTQGQGQYVLITSQSSVLTALPMTFSYTKTRPKTGGAMVSIVYTAPLVAGNVTVKVGRDYTFNFSQQLESSDFMELKQGRYTVDIVHSNGSVVELSEDLQVNNGGIYTVIIQPTESDPKKLIMLPVLLSQLQELHILWQVPQYAVITAGEIMFSISGLEFSYSQAPVSMKSLMQAAWLLTVAVGNLVDVILAGSSWLPKQSSEFFLFSGLMAVCTIIFAIMTCFYDYVVIDTEDYHDIGAVDNAKQDGGDMELSQDGNQPQLEEEKKQEDSSAT